MKPQEPYQAEVTQHLVKGMTPIFSSHTLWVSCNPAKNTMLATSYLKWNTKIRSWCYFQKKCNKLPPTKFYRTSNLQRTKSALTGCKVFYLNKFPTRFIIAFSPIPSLTNISKTFFFTSTGVHLQLAVNVAFVHQGMENVEDAVDIPDLWVVPQEFNLFLWLLGCLTAILTEGLELKKGKV